MWELQFTQEALAELMLIEEEELRNNIHNSLMCRLCVESDPRLDTYVKPLHRRLAGFWLLKYKKWRVIFKLYAGDLEVWEDFPAIPEGKRVLRVHSVVHREQAYKRRRG